MGYAECNSIMESRIGSVSSGLGCSPGVRGQTLKSSPFCPLSSSKLTQSIVKDHMVSHYKKVYSAKAAVDASVPKSLILSVKYNDQIRQERLKKGGRPQSAHSLLQRNSRALCSSPQSRSSVQYDDSPYLCSRSSMTSSPRFNTSFHAKEIVYPLHKVGSQNQSHYAHTDTKYQSREAASRRKQSACSLAGSGDASYYKTFKDPVQKTYSGDLLQKHSEHFTQDKPFTPKTLKSEKSSYLSKYRYYRAPRRTTTQDCTRSKLNRQETYHGSTKNKEFTEDFYEQSQGYNTEHEWTEDEFNGTCLSTSRQQSHALKSRDYDYSDFSSRASPRSGKSPIMRSVCTEEEELMYLEFISAVTEDILSRGHISERVLDRVTKRHIDMNRHLLDEGKMRHLLEKLRKDFEEPANISSTELEKKENCLLDVFLGSGRKREKAKENSNLFPYVSLSTYYDSTDADPPMVSTPLYSPERTASPTKTNEQDGEDDNLEKGTSSPWLNEHVSDNAAIDEEDFHLNQIDSTAMNREVSNDSHECTSTTSDKGLHQDEADLGYDGQSQDLEDLEKSFSESLHVHNNAETAAEEHTVASVSDDEF